MDAAGPRARPRRRARADRRRAGVARRGGRARDGAHDARRWVALPQPRSPSRAAALRGHDARGQRARSARPNSATPRVAARAVGQRAHLPRALTSSSPNGSRSSTSSCSMSATRDRRGFQLAKLAKHVRSAAGSPTKSTCRAARSDRTAVRRRPVDDRARTGDLPSSGADGDSACDARRRDGCRTRPYRLRLELRRHRRLQLSSATSTRVARAGADEQARYRIDHDALRSRRAAPRRRSTWRISSRATLPRQRVRSHELSGRAAPAGMRPQRSTTSATPSISSRSSRRITRCASSSRSVVAVAGAGHPRRSAPSEPWEAVRDSLLCIRRARRIQDASEFGYPSPYVGPTPELAEFARESFAGPRRLEAAVDLMHRIHREFIFDPRPTTDRDAGDARARRAARRLPGLRAPADRAACDRSGSPPATSAATCSTDPAAGTPAAGRRRRVARLAVRLVPTPGWVDLDPTNDVARRRCAT